MQHRAPRRSFSFLVLLGLALLAAPRPAVAQWDPGQGQWGRVGELDLRVMTWNVRDALCSTNSKVEGQNSWTACARIVAALRPDVLVLQECGDNQGNGTGGSTDGVSTLQTVLGLFFYGGNDPFNGGNVGAWVRKYAPAYDLPYRFVSSLTDGFNRNVVLSRYPFADLNGDSKSQYADIPTVSADQYAPGGDGGIRGFQFAEIALPDHAYPGDLVVGNAHLKAGGGSSDHDERTVAARNVAYFVDHWFNGAGSGVPDPNGRIADSPPATSILADRTPVVLMGDWNEQEGTNGQKGPARWLTQAAQAGGTDGTDRDRSDATYDDARHPFTNAPGTFGGTKLDYLAWQDSIAALRLSFVFNTSGTPPSALPPELIGMPNPQAASSVASDHLPVLADLVLPTHCDSAPSNYCIGAQNSIGASGSIGYTGSTSIAANDFQLEAQSVRPNQNGLFYYGPQAAQIPFGDGFRCVTGGGGVGIFRLYPVLTADAFGDVSRPLDFGVPPAGSGPGAVLPGSTWHFQYWYRDPGGPGGSGFNFTDGLRATFCP